MKSTGVGRKGGRKGILKEKTELSFHGLMFLLLPQFKGIQMVV